MFSTNIFCTWKFYLVKFWNEQRCRSKWTKTADYIEPGLALNKLWETGHWSVQFTASVIVRFSIVTSVFFFVFHYWLGNINWASRHVHKWKVTKHDHATLSCSLNSQTVLLPTQRKFWVCPLSRVLRKSGFPIGLEQVSFFRAHLMTSELSQWIWDFQDGHQNFSGKIHKHRQCFNRMCAFSLSKIRMYIRLFSVSSSRNFLSTLYALQTPQWHFFPKSH